jgi:hypothetical protein
MDRNQEKQNPSAHQRETNQTISHDLRQSSEFREQKREQAGNQPRDDQGRFISRNKQDSKMK